MAGPRDVDASFLSLPLSALTEAALTRAVDLGCEHADIRVERIRTQSISLRDARLESLADGEDLGWPCAWSTRAPGASPPASSSPPPRPCDWPRRRSPSRRCRRR
jgi:hypothetical protein